MKFNVTNLPRKTLSSECLLLGVFEQNRLATPTGATDIDKQTVTTLTKILRRGDLSKEPGDSLLLYDIRGISAPRVLLYRLGAKDELDPSRFQRVFSLVVQRLLSLDCSSAAFDLSGFTVSGVDCYWQICQLALLLEQHSYRFCAYKGKGAQPLPRLGEVVFHLRDADASGRAKKALAHATAIGAGVRLARDLANQPPNVCTPAYLAKQAEQLAKTHSKINVKIFKPRQLEKMKMNMLLAVAQGSEHGARLIQFTYRPESASTRKPIVLIGKGVTFDSGGISIKPSGNMDEMKFDMCGAASVFGTMAAAAMLELPIPLVGIVAAAENMPSGKASRPGDIVTSMSGQTVEILNTDAEGRLILCDALHYALQHKPDVMIDIATLTGACVIALGKHASGLLGNHQPLVEALLHAGEAIHDRAWQLPLWPDYQKQLDSPFADVANIGGREAGTVTAACFLSRFVDKTDWAHLDIAGTAWLSGKNKGATGRPVPLLVQYLLDRAATD